MQRLGNAALRGNGESVAVATAAGGPCFSMGGPSTESAPATLLQGSWLIVVTQMSLWC